MPLLKNRTIKQFCTFLVFETLDFGCSVLWDSYYDQSSLQTNRCPFSSKCYNKSNETHALWICVCQLGLIMKSDGSACIPPPPTTTSPRPIPSLAPGEKAAATVLTRYIKTFLPTSKTCFPLGAISWTLFALNRKNLDWLDQDDSKQKRTTKNIEKLQLCSFIMPEYNKTKLDCVRDNEHT